MAKLLVSPIFRSLAMVDDYPLDSLLRACQNGKGDLALFYLDERAKAATPSEAASDRNRALFVASQCGHRKLTEALLARGANVRAIDSDGYTPLHSAAKYGHAAVAKVLLQRKPDIDAWNPNGLTPLVIAASLGYLDVVTVLLENQANPDRQTKGGLSPLHLAGSEGHVAVVRALLRHGAGVNAVDVYGSTSLLSAAETGNLEVARALLEHKASVTKARSNGDTPLFVAAQNGRADLVELLVEHGADVNVSSSRTTPLFIAAQNGYLNVVASLLKNQANVDTGNVNGATPLYIAAAEGHLFVVEFLLKHRARVDAAARKSKITPLYIAAKHGHVDVVTTLLQHGADVNHANTDEATPLYIASEMGHERVVAILLKNFANVDAVVVKGATPIGVATQRGHLGVVRQLLKYQARTDAEQCGRAQPLYLACQHNYLSIVIELLEHGVDVDARYKDSTPLMFSAMKGYVGVVSALLRHGADVNAAGVNGVTPLQAAVAHNQLDVATTLLEHQARVDAQSDNGASPLVYAAAYGQLDAVEALLKHRHAGIKDATVDGRGPLHVASENGHLNVVVFLLEHHAKVDAKTNVGTTPLHLAAGCGYVSVVAALLKHHAAVNARDEMGRSPLFFAANAGYVHVVSVLLAHHADVNIEDTHGLTPLFHAALVGRAHVVALLLENGANVEAATSGGATSLHAAALEGRIEVIELILEAHSALGGVTTPKDAETQRRAQLDAVDSGGYTPVMLAAKRGHLSAVEVFLRAGVSACVRTRDGNTLLLLAAQWGEARVVSLLDELNLLEPKSIGNVHASVVSVTVETLRQVTPHLNEFQGMWKRILDHLECVYNHLHGAASAASRDSSYQVSMATFRLAQLMPRLASENVIQRLVASQTVAQQLRALHIELDFLEKTDEPIPTERMELNDWRSGCKSDELALLERFRAHIDDPATPALSSEDRADLELLLAYKLQEHASSSELSELLQLGLSKLRESEVAPLPEIPSWFIPSYELEVASMRTCSENTGDSSLVPGRALGSEVMISRHPASSESSLTRECFVEMVDRCHPLAHPNVVKIFGASHLSHEFVVVYEDALSTNLREYLLQDGNEHLVWRKLLEVARGLEYLFEQGIAIDHVRCDEIWIGTNGEAKINAFACESSRHLSSTAKAQHVRWHAPEETAMISAIVYSFAMCILEAYTGKVPWESETNPFTIASKAKRGRHPALPVGMAKAQCDLLTRMWAIDPSKRPSLKNVVLQLKVFVDTEVSESKLRKVNKLLRAPKKQPVLDFTSYKFPDLGMTMQTYLKKLSQVCGRMKDVSSKSTVLQILDRLNDVYKLIQVRQRFLGDPAIVSFCTLLQRFYDLMKAWSSPGSVLQREKNPRVSLESQEFHKRLDDLLRLINPSTVRSVHEWKHETAEPRLCASGAPNAQDPNTAKAKRGTEARRALAAQVVVIQRFDGDNATEQATGVNLGANAATSNTDYLNGVQLIQEHELTDITRIGKGSFGEVFKATWQDTPDVVVKVMGNERDKDAKARELFLHELQVWSRLNHPHVLKLYGACVTGKHFFACEYAGNGTLEGYMGRNPSLDEGRKWRLLHQVGLGLRHLHQQNISHNDLKFDNVLVTTDGSAKIADLGLASILNVAELSIDPEHHGSHHWRSPEYLRGERLSLASDVYSFGMLIIAVMTGGVPWGRSTEPNTVRTAVVKQARLPPQPTNMTNSQWSLIRAMCAANPSDRVEINSVIEKLVEFENQERIENSTSKTRPAGAVTIRLEAP